MIIIYPPKHNMHNPPYEIFEGKITLNPELPARVGNILKSLILNGFSVSKNKKIVPLGLISRVHSREYLKFISTINAVEPLYPSVFPKKVTKNLNNRQGLLGFYSLDTYTPISAATYKAALESASCAYEVAMRIQAGEAQIGYALCRPPGHHAERSQMGGYCYLNNAAIAAEHLSSFGKVAILDLDFHHGNGTQSIFYNRADVLYASIHADPSWKFPHLSGFIDEVGEGAGKGFNINIPLGPGTEERTYLNALEIIVEKIAGFEPAYLIISLGTDTHKDDPICGFNLSTGSFLPMAKIINTIQIPTIIIQEGGYNPDIIGDCVVNFLNGFSKNT